MTQQLANQYRFFCKMFSLMYKIIFQNHCFFLCCIYYSHRLIKDMVQCRASSYYIYPRNNVFNIPMANTPNLNVLIYTINNVVHMDSVCVYKSIILYCCASMFSVLYEVRV